ncbi:MAG: tripartite tricarboxylate transporter TctB family protein [Chloroflexi bacterium]|nr:tripartite tricarboxylate transporter TctB family protein [Chloroflexota bacterium]
MKLRGISYCYIAIMALMLAVIGFSLGMQYFTSKVMPIIISGAVFILTGVALWKEIAANGVQSTATKTVRDNESAERETKDSRAYLVGGGWIMAFALGIWLVGFLVAIPLFILTYMKRHGTMWLISVAFAVLIPLIIYSVFQRVLHISLYQGLIFALLGY